MQNKKLLTMFSEAEQSDNISPTTSRSQPIPRIIWVAARPPVPPFTGITSKTLCGLTALSNLTEVDIVTFDDESFRGQTTQALQDYWKDRLHSSNVLPYTQKMAWHAALRRHEFQLTSTFASTDLAKTLSNLDWTKSDRLIIFDDILLAPIAHNYAANALLSPHDCMSQMFLSHAKYQKLLIDKLRKYLQYQIAQHYEKKFYHSVLLVHLVTERDRVLLENINAMARYHVVPNADLLNPGLIKDFDTPWDILIWGDLTVAACAQGTQAFLSIAEQSGLLATSKVILVGKITKDEAEHKVDPNLIAKITYAPRLEDEAGKIRTAKIVLIPDIGGAGIKNRVVNVVSSGLCLACLIPQVEGIGLLADRGAINAVSMDELVQRIYWTLKTRTYKDIAQLGEQMYRDNYSSETNHKLWHEMLLRAVAIRDSSVKLSYKGSV